MIIYRNERVKNAIVALQTVRTWLPLRRFKPPCPLVAISFAMTFKAAALVPGNKTSGITLMPVNEDKKSQRHLELAT